MTAKAKQFSCYILNTCYWQSLIIIRYICLLAERYKGSVF